jgi:hypothetical protein
MYRESVVGVLRSPKACVVAYSTWWVAVIAVLFATGAHQSGRIVSSGFGPSDTLYFATAHINTWPKWLALVGFVMADALLGSWCAEVVQPWIITSVYAPAERRLEYGHAATGAITTLYKLWETLRLLLPFYLALTQLDVLAVYVLSVVAVTAVTSWAAIRRKARPLADYADLHALTLLDADPPQT